MSPNTSLEEADMNEVSAIHQRLKWLIEYFCAGNAASFGRATSIQSGVLAGITGGRKSKPGFELLQKIVAAYPSVNPTWLLLGCGPRLAASTADEVASAGGSSMNVSAPNSPESSDGLQKLTGQDVEAIAAAVVKQLGKALLQ
jgi:hypothetical protein